jgi:putative ABC transport system permease protein
VRSAGWATTLPLGNAQIGQNRFQIVGDPPPASENRPEADYQIVSPTYFQTLQLPIVAGRSFTARDTADNVLVCIVNEAFVRRYAAGRDPIGLRVTTAAIVGNVAREIVRMRRSPTPRPSC